MVKQKITKSTPTDKKSPVWNSQKQICKLFKTPSNTVSVLSRQFNCSRKTIYNILKQNKVSISK